MIKLITIVLASVIFFSPISAAAIISPEKIDKSILAKDQTFHRGNSDEVESLDPHKSTGVSSSNIIMDLYEGLMTYDQDGKLILGQAAAYEISPDLKQYTFKLRDNLKWSNGEPLLAQDFVVGMRRTVDPKTASVYSDILKPIKNAEQIITGKLSPDMLGIKSINDKTLVIQLEKPTPYFLELLTHTSTLPIYQPNLKKYGDEFTMPGKHVSNGAFQLKDWVVHSHLIIEKNPNFREAEQVVLKNVVFYPIQEQSVELKRYRAGDLHYTSAIPDVQFEWIKSNLNNELYVAPYLGTYYFGYNVEKKPFLDNINLRKALAFAIDKKIIAEKVLRSGQIATDFLVPIDTNNYRNELSSSSNESLNSITQSQRDTLAKEYLKKSGYDVANPTKVKILYNTQESHKSVAIAIAAMWKKKLGVPTELINQEWKVFLRTRQERKETECFREGWIGDFNDPMSFLDLYVSTNPQNHSGYHNKQYDSLIDKASRQKNLKKRAEILFQAEEILLEDAPIIPLYTYVSRHLVKPNVGNFATNLLDRTYDRYVYIKNS